MESLYEMIKKNGTGKGEAIMWKSVKVISDSVDEHMDDDAKRELIRDIYAEMSGGHYNEQMAMEDVSHMYYMNEAREKEEAPYWTKEQVASVYNNIRNEIPDYNMWDFYVTLNMVKSDNCPMLKRWFPEADMDEMTQKLVEMSVNWLKDDDNPFGTEKVWKYLNSK